MAAKSGRRRVVSGKSSASKVHSPFLTLHDSPHSARGLKPETNPKNAQMVFITHDTNLLDSRRMRRDQIWFVEKDHYGASHLYAFSDFKEIRRGGISLESNISRAVTARFRSWAVYDAYSPTRLMPSLS